MNLIDLAVVLILAFGVIRGIYKGFLNTLFGCIAVLAALLLSLITSPLLSGALSANENLRNGVASYVEGAAQFNAIDERFLNIETTDRETLIKAVDETSISNPYANLIKRNVINKSFVKYNINTLGDYASRTLANAFLNTVCFLMFFVFYYLIARFIINILDFRNKFPVLKVHEKSFAGFSGFVLYALLTYMFFLLVSIGLMVANMSVLTNYVNSSFLGSIFYKGNIFAFLIRG